VQLCVGGYWPSVGALRGRMVMPELRASTITLCRVLTLLISAAVLTLIHFNSLLTLTACASLFGVAAYLQTHLNQSSLPSYTDDPEYDDAEE